MNLFERKEIKYALGTIGIGAFIYGLFRAYRYFYNKTSKQEKEVKKTLEEANQSVSS